MQCFGIPFKPLGPKMTKTVSCSNTSGEVPGVGEHSFRRAGRVPQVVLSSLVRRLTVKTEEGFY